MSIGSQRNFSNNFIVDGLSANDDAAGLSGIPYGVDAVEQFQVVTSGGQAELGRALGGYVNVVTKSGTNLLRGNVYGYFRDDALNGANALTGTTLPMHQNQYGASLGGPIVRDRTFYFSNFEQRQLDQSGLTTIADAERGRHQRQAGRREVSWLAGRNGRLSQSGRQHELPRQGRPPDQQPRPAGRAVRLLRRDVVQLARRGRAGCPVGIRGARQHRSGCRSSATRGCCRRGRSTRRARSTPTAI